MNVRSLTHCAWGLPLLVFAADANAWGLYTHLYFAQYILLASPMLDPRLQAAMKKFPQLVMAGACLPDLALISKHFKTTHQWQQAADMLNSAASDEELAIAVGYTSHLFVDIVAHNHFVPAFEAKWSNDSLITHVVAEWAMDAHITQHIQARPFTLLRQHADALTPFISKCFQVKIPQARKALQRLAWADKALRFSRLSSLLLNLVKRKDDELLLKLNYYLLQTYEALTHFELVLQGRIPSMYAELTHMSATEMAAWREKCLSDVRLRLTTAVHVFQHYDSQFTAQHLS
ncbi:MAG TPA: zinc dependent phospholipase C family protein [Methylophilus sp.]